MEEQYRQSETSEYEKLQEAEYHRIQAEAHKNAAKSQWILFLKTGVFVIAIVVIVLAVLAWFVSTHENEGKAMSVKSDKASLAISSATSYNYKKVLNINEDGTSTPQYVFQKKTDMISPNELEMAYYDGINDENSKTPIILKCNLSGKNIEEQETVQVMFSNTFTDWKNASGHLNQKLSNITNVRCAYIPESSFDIAALDGENADEKIWRIATSYLKEQNPKTFVSKENLGVKDKTLTFTIEGGTYTPKEKDKSIDVYFMIDYDEELILRYVMDNSLSSDIGRGSTSTKIDFENDFSNITVMKN